MSNLPFSLFITLEKDGSNGYYIQVSQVRKLTEVKEVIYRLNLKPNWRLKFNFLSLKVFSTWLPLSK